MEFIKDITSAKIQKTIHLIRHGQTDFNKLNIIQGSGINSNLNETGVEQASKFYSKYRFTPYKHIYTSKLSRTIETVQAFIDLNKIPHTAMAELNEINWGIMEGIESNPENKKLYTKTIQEWSSGNLNITVEGGETPLQMFERQNKGINQIMLNNHEDIILICMHGRALRSFLCLLTGIPLFEMEKWEHSNLCLYVLEFNGDKFEIIKENDIMHLLED